MIIITRIFLTQQCLLLVLLLYKEVISDCRLHPISYGFYYGINEETFRDAKSCCKSKELSIVTIKDKPHFHRLRDALLSESFWAEPIGPSNGLFITTNSKSIQGYYPMSFAMKMNESLAPGTKSSRKSCSIVFISSPRTADLKIMGVDCKMRNRFVCERKQKFDTILSCPLLNYTELVEDTYIYSYDKLEWRDAAECCEMKGGELFRFDKSSDSKDLYATLIDNAIIQRNNSNNFSFWTGGFKKLDKYQYTWSNYENVIFSSNSSTQEFCLKGVTLDKNVVLNDFPCERKLNFVCRVKAPAKCHGVDLKVLQVQDSFRRYYYSDHYKLSWSDAVLCCRDRGFQLFSVISPQEGNFLSAHLQDSTSLRYRHQGFRFGIWTSGRQHKEGSYEFVSVKTKIQFGKSGRNHYVEGPTNGTCLQYVVDVRNSYLLNNIPCKSIRSFICETPDRLPSHFGINMKEIGNKYYYSNVKSTWSDAFDICKSHRMTMLDLRNAEEKSAMALVIEQLLGNQQEKVMWSAMLEPVMSMDHNPKPVALRNKDQRQTRYRGPDRYRSNFRQQRGRAVAVRSNFDDNNNKAPVAKSDDTKELCDVTYVSEQRIRIAHNYNCTERLNFICEKQDRLYGKCDPSAQVVVREYVISHKLASWKEARKCCEQIGRSLITLDPRTLTNIYQDIKEKYQRPQVGVWTSGTNAIVHGKWIWTGNYRFVESNDFFHNYTTHDVMTIVEDNHECLEAFAHIQDGKVMWDHDDCYKPKPYICDKVIQPPLKCSNIRFEQLRRTGFYYGIVAVRWAQALECCLERGMTLVEIHDSKANDMLFQFVAERSRGIHNNPDLGLWIGLTSYISNHTTFTWVNSKKTIQETNFTSWHPELDVPFDPNLSCAAVYTDDATFSWKNLECSKKLKFICQLSQV